MAKKNKKLDGEMLEVTTETVTTISKTELLQKKAGLEEEIAGLTASLVEVDEQLGVLG